MPYLSINTEGKPSIRRTLDGAMILGRSRDCQIPIDDHRLSRHHCRFEPAVDGSWSVIDLASTNGTFVSGQNIRSRKLEDGDEINAGRTRMIFHARATPPSRPPQPTRSVRPDDSAGNSTSPSDTLVDSRFRMPRIDPGSAGVKKSEDVAPHGGAKNERRTPLPFQRPPAKPIVPGGATGDTTKSNFFRAIWRRIAGR